MSLLWTTAGTLRMCIGVVGAAAERPGWFCPNFRSVTDDCLNSLHYCDGEENFQLFCWTFSWWYLPSRQGTRRPCGSRRAKEKGNKQTSSQVFRDDAIAEIEIPSVIVAWNFEIKWVNLFDQLVDYSSMH